LSASPHEHRNFEEINIILRSERAEHARQSKSRLEDEPEYEVVQKNTKTRKSATKSANSASKPPVSRISNVRPFPPVKAQKPGNYAVILC